MHTKRGLVGVLAFVLATGAAWASDENPMSAVDDNLLMGRPTAQTTAASDTDPREPVEATATFEDTPTSDEQSYADEDQALSFPDDDTPIAPMTAELTESVASDLGSYTFLTGDTLRKALERWGADANYDIVWRAETDFNVDIEMAYPRGTRFEEAVEQTLAAFWRRGAELTGTLYRNRVLVITERTAQ